MAERSPSSLHDIASWKVVLQNFRAALSLLRQNIRPILAHSQPMPGSFTEKPQISVQLLHGETGRGEFQQFPEIFTGKVGVRHLNLHYVSRAVCRQDTDLFIDGFLLQ